jgi:site-specific DNA-cytosine methylase
MDTIVVIASSTRGFVTLRAGVPPVINPYPGTYQDQDEKGSLNPGSSCRTARTKTELSETTLRSFQDRRKKLIAFLKPGAKADSLPPKVWNGARPEKWRRLHPDRPAYTILAQMHRDLSEWVHPDHQRWITVREAARLQSFHDGFIFKTSEWQMLKQIGNTVPPLLARAPASATEGVLERLDDADICGDTSGSAL